MSEDGPTKPGDEAAVTRLEARIGHQERELEQAKQAIRASVQELQSARARLAEAERLTALGIIASTIAHEVGNPLMGVINAISYARRHAEHPGVLEALEEARTQLVRIEELARSLLRLSRTGGSGPQRADVSDVVAAAAAAHRYEFEQLGIRLENEIPAGLPPVAADRQRLEQVFGNLLENARDAVAQRPAKRIRITAHQVDHQIELEVSNSGEPIDDTLRERIFDPFFTTKSDRGSGLGLPIARSIVESFGGRIGVRGEEAGTVFSVALPVAGPGVQSLSP